MAYKNVDELMAKAPGIVAIAKAQGLTISDLEAAHVEFSGDCHRILGFLPVYMIYWAVSEKRYGLANRLAAELDKKQQAASKAKSKSNKTKRSRSAVAVAG